MRPLSPVASFRRGFTLVELLVSIGVIGLLVALTVPAVQQARETARRAECGNHLRQLGLALHHYHDTFRMFPPGANKSNQLSWHVFLLPQIEQGALYSQFRFDEGDYYSSTVNHKNNPHGLQRIELYLCPSCRMEHSLTSLDAIDSQKTWTTHYYGIMGPRGEKPDGTRYRELPVEGLFADQGLLGLDSVKSFREITDGSSNTYAIGEIAWNDANSYRTWVRGTIKYTMSGCKNVVTPIGQSFMVKELDFNDISLGSEHPGGAQILFADGGVRFVAETIDLFVYKGGASIDGSEDVSF